MSKNMSMTELSDNPYYSSPQDGYKSYTGNPSAPMNRDPWSQDRPPNDGVKYYPPRSPRDKKREDAPPQEKSKGIKHLLSVFAEKTSLNGIIFIKTSKYHVVRLLWLLLLLGAIAFMFYHLYRLGKNYYSYEKQSKLDLNFEKLQFPAVTVCNVNAIKKTQLHLASQDLNDLVEMVNPTEMGKDVDDWEPGYEDNDLFSSGDDMSGDGEIYKRRRKRGATPDGSGNEGSGSGIKVKHRINNFFDDFNFTNSDTGSSFEENFSGDTYRDSWEAESETASFDQINTEFTDLYSKENTTTRALMGHQIQDMLVQCSFAGRKCYQSNFTLVPTTTLGNCFTLEYSKFVTRKSGPRLGLSLILFLEKEEYVPGITNSQGIQVVIHEPRTLPFPDDEGFVVSAGSEAMVGLRRVTIKRLGHPWGNCTEVETFQKRYQIKYTRQACQELCQMEMVMDKCGCFDANKPVVYAFLTSRNESCQTSDEQYWCMQDVEWEFEENQSLCNCDSPCNEVQYRKTISSKNWPNRPFAELVSKTVCRERNVLCDVTDLTEAELREQFVKLTVFYETLNYEKLSEEPDYSEFQFISDIGGTVGLYIGLSVLSMCEVFHLLAAIVGYLCCRNKKKN